MAPLVLLTSWPFVAFLANNLDQTLRSREVVLPWAAMLAVAVASTLALSLLLHKQPLARIAIVIGVLSAVFFSFGSVAHLLILAGIEFGTTWLGVWLIVFVAAGWVSWVLAQRPSAGFVMTVVGLALIAWPTMQIIANSGGTLEPRADLSSVGKTVTNRTSETKQHNVYWFLLDGYARDDSLARYFNHDNQPFLDFLTARGFQIAHSAFANYDNTTLSLTSTLNITYRQLPNGDPPNSAEQISTLSGFNPVVRGFDALGYRYFHAPYAGAAKTQCGGSEDRCIHARPSGDVPLNEVQISLLKLTPLFRISRRILPGAFRYDHIFVEDVMAAISPTESSPFFLFAHILSPHAPPRFAPDCTRLKGVISAVDIGEGVYDPIQFRTDTVCTNRSLEDAVTQVLANDDTDPIIILQGDHGFKFRLPGEAPITPEGVTLGEEPARRLATLNALRLPATCQTQFHDALSPVNTFRLVFACLKGQMAALLPDRHFLRQRGANGGLVEVDPVAPEPPTGG
ncbi:MAG: hypothetical protein CL573_01845 [Alphaproteobacteria bacterium]|nr:hypothetical protein [Alphaproteobacteria bacterium]